MKNKKTNLFLFVACTLCMILPDQTLAKSGVCTVGRITYYTFLAWGSGPCPKGCFCPGETYVYVNSNEGAFCSRQTNDIRNAGNQKCELITSGAYKGLYGCTPYGNNGNCIDKFYRCPDDFPNSNEGSTSIEQCYTKVGEKPLHYKKITCNPGEYLPINSENCEKCKTNGYNYCPGIKDKYPSLKKDQGLETCSPEYKPSQDKKTCVLKQCSFGQVMNSAKTQCVPATEDCGIGEYLPKNTLECAPCPAGKYCAQSQTYTFSADKDQGITGSCDSSQSVNASRSGCEGNGITCIAGTYLPAHSLTCAACPDGYYCPQGTWTQQPIDQGNERCSGSTVPNEKRTACIQGAITVSAGYYLPANATESVVCKGAKSYCPGGTFDKASKDQGIFDCPNGARTNKDKNACSITLKAEQMKACWTDFGDPDKYKTCVLAKRYYK